MTASPSTATTINTYKFSIGVGTEHTYTYDINERLKSATLTLHKDIISTNTYTYDKTDNITGIRGVSESLYNQKYTYDDMNRLTGASGMDTGGKSDDGSAFSSYVMTMSYDQMSSPQRYELTKMSQSDTKVTENEYLYSADSSNPHAPMQIGDMTYTYSASGNPLTIEGSKISRTLTWDSENRLRELTDQRRGIQSRYTYNHRGERSLKRYGAYESMAVNGVATGSLLDPKSAYSAYVSPYYVEHGRGTESGAVTKHYYAGAERLASKVVTSATGAKGESQNGTQSSAQTEESTYYYFTDHLGSTTHITDKGSKVVQYAAYTPYGTLFREYKSVMPYKFNGKELDQETGYYYYGARYYDPGTALWFGTDPLAHKYPMNSPYVYCNANPVKHIDADGNIPTAVVGAIIGVMVNATIAAIEGKSGSEIMAAAAGGAVSGAIIGSGGFLFGAVSGAAGDIVEQSVNIMLGTSDEYDMGQTATSTIVGGVFGYLGKYGKDVIKDTGEKAIKSIDSKFSRNSTFNKFLNEVKSDFKSAGKPTQGHSARSQMNTEAKSRLKSERSFQIGVSEIKTKLKEHGVDVSTGTAGTLINHKLSTHQDE